MGDDPGFAVGIGASAGGVEALTRLVSTLPEDLPAAVLIVLHIPASTRSLLPQILERHTTLPASTAEDGAPLTAGTIVVAPPDRHLLVANGHVVLERGPKENGARPAVDPMLRSLATAFGPRSIAVVLSGALGDGSVGARAVAAAGGSVLVQDPADATVPSMPESALAAVGSAALRISAGAAGPHIARLVKEALREEHGVMASTRPPIEDSSERPSGPLTGLSCPECHGALWELDGGERYRCRVGHAYSVDALVSAQGSSVEAALWTALEVLEERADLLQRVARRYASGRTKTQERMMTAARDAIERAELIRRALAGGPRGADAIDVEPKEATG
jgi:two-component system, chemotaxis family, protein-glutamate methylesterase/glutaminase